MKAEGKEADLGSVFNWLQDHAALISAIASLATVVIWLLYLQLFYAEFRRRRNLLVFIHQTFGQGSDSICTVINLSAQPVHVVCVVAEFELSGEKYLQCVSRYDRQPEGFEEQRSVRNLMDQGPLKPGEFLSIGTLDGLLGYALERGGLAEQIGYESDDALETARERLEAISIHVVVMHPSYGDHPIGASRRFRVSQSPEGRLYQADSVRTRQLKPPGGRREVQRWLSTCLGS